MDSGSPHRQRIDRSPPVVETLTHGGKSPHQNEAKSEPKIRRHVAHNRMTTFAGRSLLFANLRFERSTQYSSELMSICETLLARISMGRHESQTAGNARGS